MIWVPGDWEYPSAPDAPNLLGYPLHCVPDRSVDPEKQDDGLVSEIPPNLPSVHPGGVDERGEAWQCQQNS